MQPLILTLPGYRNSGPDHWQSHWERQDPHIRRVMQRDWEQPHVDEWTATLEHAVAAAQGRPIILVGHGCGSLTAVHWAQRYAPRVAGALLVAPPDVERADLPEALRRFGPVPLAALPFPCLLVVSSDDRWLGAERAQQFAEAWGGDLVDIGPAGHVNAESGHGPWPEGRALLEHLCDLAMEAHAR